MTDEKDAEKQAKELKEAEDKLNKLKANKRQPQSKTKFDMVQCPKECGYQLNKSVQAKKVLDERMKNHVKSVHK